MAGTSLSYVKEMIAQGNVEAAIKSLVAILQANNRDIDAWLLLAEIMDEPVRKRDCYRQVLKWSPDNLDALQGLEKLEAQEPARDAKPASPRSDADDAVGRVRANEEQVGRAPHPHQKRSSFFSDTNSMARIKRLLVFGFLFLTVACIGTTAYLYFSFNQLMWRNLGTPPEKAVRIIDGDYKAVHAQAASGNIYFCQFKDKQECWVKSDNPLEYGYRTQPYDQAQMLTTYKEPPVLPGVVEIKKYFSTVDEYVRGLSVFAVTDKGNVYVWQEGFISPFDGMIFFETMPLAAMTGFVFWVLFEGGIWMSFGKRERALDEPKKANPFSGKIFFRWLVLNIVGWTIGVFLSVFPVYILIVTGAGRTLYGRAISLAGLIMLVNWIPLGVSIGYMQTLQLKQWGVNSRWWIVFSTIGWWVGSFFFKFDAFDFSIIGPIIVTLFGTLFGVSQAYLLRKVLSRNGLWVLATTLGIMGLLYLEFHILFYPPLNIYNHSMAVWAFPFLGLFTTAFPTGYLLERYIWLRTDDLPLSKMG